MTYRLKPWAEIDSLPPETLMTSLLGVSPLVPDGSGYLAVDSQDGDNPPKFVFVDWEGHQELLKDTANATAFLKKLDEERRTKEKSFRRFSVWVGQCEVGGERACYHDEQGLPAT